MPTRTLLLLCMLAAPVVGCSSTTQIQTAVPQPALPPPSDTLAAADLARLTIMVETGQTALPEAVQAMQFRVAEVYLKPADSDWVTYPADVNSFDIGAGNRARKVVLSTLIPPAAYDSLGLTLSDVFVFYDANAGGPLTMPRETPLALPLAARLTIDQPTSLRLLFEPGASLSRDADCRWYFLPFFDVMMGD